jgi:hypothetical protein
MGLGDQASVALLERLCATFVPLCWAKVLIQLAQIP